MIEIITEPVAMPSMGERKFQKDFINGKWVVIGTTDNSIRYKGSYENVVLVCHNLNKAFYRSQNNIVNG